MIIVGMIYALHRPLKCSLLSFENAALLSECFLFEFWSLGHSDNLLLGKEKLFPPPDNGKPTGNSAAFIDVEPRKG